MPLRNSRPAPWKPKGLTDAIEAGMAFNGAMTSLQNLIPNPGADGQWICRPASTPQTSFSGFSSPGFISCYRVIGSNVYGMIASSRNAGKDEPFAYSLTTGLFTTISGVTNLNTPSSPSTTGDWIPPTIDLIGSKVVITHQGFNIANGMYFGYIDISNPAAPVWNAGNLTGAIQFTQKPTCIAQFNGRAYYAQGNALVFSDTNNAINCTNGNQVLTFGFNLPVVALGGLPLQSQIQGGSVQSLIVFVDTQFIFQVTGDAAITSGSGILMANQIQVTAGTFSQNSICTMPSGLAFAGIDGVRVINLAGQVSEPIGANGQGISIPFFYAISPSRIAMSYSSDVMRVSLQNALIPGSPNQEYFYHLTKKVWSGPHTFPCSLVQPFGNNFVIAPIGVTAKLFLSSAVPIPSAVYTENGIPLAFNYTTPLIPETSEMSEFALQEQTIDMALNNMDIYTASFLNQQGAQIGDSVLIEGGGAATVWGAFTWGGATWLGVSQKYQCLPINWDQPIIFKRAQFQLTGPCSGPLQIGSTSMRLQKLGYLLDVSGQ